VLQLNWVISFWHSRGEASIVHNCFSPTPPPSQHLRSRGTVGRATHSTLDYLATSDDGLKSLSFSASRFREKIKKIWKCRCIRYTRIFGPVYDGPFGIDIPNPRKSIGLGNPSLLVSVVDGSSWSTAVQPLRTMDTASHTPAQAWRKPETRTSSTPLLLVLFTDPQIRSCQLVMADVRPGETNRPDESANCASRLHR
jgi:hypothetical protein